MAGHDGYPARGLRAVAGAAVPAGQSAQPARPPAGPGQPGELAGGSARRQLAGPVAGQRCRTHAGLAGPGRRLEDARHRDVTGGHEQARACRCRAADADRRRRDPAKCPLAADLSGSAAEPGRRDGPHPGSRGVRRAGRIVPVRVGGSVCPAGCPRQDRGHHGRQGRPPGRHHRRRLHRAAGGRRGGPHRGRPARQQPVVLPAAALLGCLRPGRARGDAGVLRPGEADMRAADRPLPHRLPASPRRAGRLPARTAGSRGLLLAAAPGLPARQAVLGRPGGPPSRHQLPQAAPRCSRRMEAARDDQDQDHSHRRWPGRSDGDRPAGRPQRADRGQGLLPRHRRMGRR